MGEEPACTWPRQGFLLKQAVCHVDLSHLQCYLRLQPLVLGMKGSTISSRTLTTGKRKMQTDSWLQVLQQAPKLLALALPRFRESDNGILKRHDPYYVLQPNLAFPTFDDDAFSLTSTNFRLQAVIIHDGPSIHQGHYRCVLHHSSDMWWLKDDNRSAVKRAFTDALELCRRKAFVLLYTRAG